jgi:hypothetical protein
MKKGLFILFFVLPSMYFSQVCNNAGNVMIFSNYDGSRETAAQRLNINVNVNIPNIKIGICSYERVTVNIGGAFAGNVTAVRYAGFNAVGNCNCYWPSTPAGCAVTTTITGVPAGIITYCVMPNSPFNNVNGYPQIICAYQCVNNANNGGCNTPQQVVQYFMNVFGGTFRSHTAQYNCWAGATYSMSTAGNCCLTVLPMELAYFDGYSDGNKNILKWQTVSEKNNDYFEVQASADGINFQTIGLMDGAGNSSNVSNYTYTDNLPFEKVTYYRLKQYNFDGSTEYSNTVVIESINKLEVIFPVPATDFLVMNKGMNPSDYSVTNSLGLEVTHLTKWMDDKINIEGLTNGVYYMAVRSRKLKFIVSR